MLLLAAVVVILVLDLAEGILLLAARVVILATGIVVFDVRFIALPAGVVVLAANVKNRCNENGISS